MNRRKSAGEPLLKSAQNQLRGAKDLRNGLSKARCLVPSADIDAFVAWLPSQRRNGRGLRLPDFPASVNDLWVASPLAPVSLVREIAWAHAVMRRSAAVLTNFRQAAESYEIALLEGDFDKATNILDGIDQRAGASLWSLETRLALLQRAHGLEAQKAYVSEVLAIRGRHDVVAFLVHHLSRRNEPSTTPLRYEQQLDVMTEPWTGSEDLAAYVKYRLVNRLPRDARGQANLLRFESSASTIDHYETFVTLSAWAAAAGGAGMGQAFATAVAGLAGVIEDDRLTRTAFLLGGNASILDTTPVRGVPAEDALALDEYTAAAEQANCDMQDDLSDSSSWIALARAGGEPDVAAAAAGGQDMTAAILARCLRIVHRTDDMDEALIRLLKEALNNRLQRFSTGVTAFLWTEMSNTPGETHEMERFAFVHGRALRPSDVGRLAGTSAARGVARLVAIQAPRSTALSEQVLRAGLDETDPVFGELPFGELPDDVTREASIVRAAVSDDHEEVLKLAAELSESGDLMRRRRVRRNVGQALLARDQVAQLATFIALSCVEDPGSASMLPVMDCANRLDRALRRERAGDIAVPIVLDIFSRRFEDSLDDVRGYAYEDFLIARGIERPSELDGVSDDVNRGLLIYYLRNVCVPDVMQVSSAFQGTRELEDERKKVLSLLVKLDPDSAKEYEKELREVARAQLIHRGVRQVERSKIYVDVPAIRRAFDRKHRETFQRWQALARAGIGTDRRELEAAIEEALAGKPLRQELLEVPRNEADDLLLQMLRWLFVECTGSPEHGLDCYLSMRIRHGTLSGQLRSPLEVERVITQRTAEDGEYASNAYWLEHLGQLTDVECSAVDERLARFSAEYDNLIARIAGEMVQIRAPAKPEGLFVIDLKSVRFRLWLAGLTPDMSFEAFFDELIELFWESVERSLENVRSTIDHVLKPEIGRLFAVLEVDVARIAGGSATSDLDRAVRLSRTGAMQALDIVADWFRLSQPVSEPPFPIDDMIDVGLQCVTAIHRDFTPVVERELDPLPPFAHALVRFSDIFFIIFDNVRRHSGLNGRPHVRISVRDEGDRLRITARNDVSAAARAPETLARIEAIRQAISEGDYRQAVTSEGGTGLIKLRKLIGYEGIRSHDLEFGFEGDEFKVVLEMGKREIER